MQGGECTKAATPGGEKLHDGPEAQAQSDVPWCSQGSATSPALK